MAINSKPSINIPTYRHIFALAWPMTLKAIMLHGIVVIDGYLVSAMGEKPLAAMGVAAAIAGLPLGVIFAFSGAMQIRTAQACGTGDKIFVKSVITSGLALSLSIGVVGLLAIFTLAQPFVDYISPDPQVAKLAWDYLAIFVLVIFFEAIGQCLSSFFNGHGQTKIPLISFCLSIPVNVLASIILIYGYAGIPSFGVAGAAMGSALAVGVQTIYLVVKMFIHHGDLRQVIGWRQHTFFKTLIRHIVFCLPIATSFVSVAITTQICSIIYAQMSIVAFAAMTIITPWNMVVGQVSMQWTQATGIMVAQLIGQKASADELDRFLSIAWRGAFVTAIFGAGIFLILCLSTDWIYSELSGETRAILLSFLPILLVLPFLKASNAICGNTLRASGDTVYVMHIFVWSQWLFRVPATAIMALYFNLDVFWILSLFLIEEILKFPAFHHRLRLGLWKKAQTVE